MHVMLCFVLVLINYPIYFFSCSCRILNLLFGFGNLGIYSL